MIDNYKDLFDQNKELQVDLQKKINDCERILDNSDMKYKILLQEKNKENERLKKEIISLSENLEKFRSICQRKVKGVYALQEQKGKQSVKDHKELFEYAIEMFNKRIKDCKGQINAKDVEMQAFFNFLKEQQSKGNIRYKSDKNKRSKRKSQSKNKSSKKPKKRTSKK